MTNIERYLSGDVEYGDLTDAERCAVCAAMEGEWVDAAATPIFEVETTDGKGCRNTEYRAFKCVHTRVTFKSGTIQSAYFGFGDLPNYLDDGTAALRLVERFRIDLTHVPDHISAILGHGLPLTEKYPIVQNGPSAAAAIVHAVCELARAQWPYRWFKA